MLPSPTLPWKLNNVSAPHIYVCFPLVSTEQHSSHEVMFKCLFLFQMTFQCFWPGCFCVFQPWTHKNQTKPKVWYRDLSCSTENAFAVLSQSNPTFPPNPSLAPQRKKEERYLVPGTMNPLLLYSSDCKVTLAKPISVDCMALQLKEVKSMCLEKSSSEKNIIFRENIW